MIDIDGDVYPDGVTVDVTDLGRIRVAEFGGVHGVWLQVGDDLLGIVHQPEFGFPYIMAACDAESKHLASIVPQIVAYHDPDHGLMVQVPDGDRARSIPYHAALAALLAIPL